MTENLEDLPVSFIENSSSDTINVTDREMLKELIDNQQKILEKLQSMEDEKSGKKRGREDNDSSNENRAKRVDLLIPKERVSGESQSPIFEKTGKWFTLKHTFKSVSELEQGIRNYSEEQEHVGSIWKMYILRSEEHLGFFTWCANKNAKEIWSIETDCEVKLLTSDGKHEISKSCALYKKEKIEEIKESVGLGWENYKKWNELDEKYLIDGSLTLEVSFKIKNMTGIYKNDLRCFDDPDCSDIVLIVQDKKFHALKLYLATNAIDEYTVEGLLMVADMFDTPIIIQKCEEFLLKESKKTLKKKLEMSIRYSLDELKKKCLSEIKTIDDIRRVIPGDIKDLDPSIMAILFEKSLAFN